MLPQGKYILNNTQGVRSLDQVLQSFSQSHASWQTELKRLHPWESVETAGFGDIYSSQLHASSTTVLVESCDSTMLLARQLADEGYLGEWGAVISCVQANGRGQLRRPWVSSPGNLHVSVVLPSLARNASWTKSLPQLRPLLLGYVLTNVLSQLGAELLLKWPNDLLQNGRKVGGLLLEEQDDLVILGFGLNLVKSPPDEMMREDRSASAGKIEISQSVTPLSLWETLVSRIESVYSILLDELEPQQFISLAEKRLAWLGRNVLVRDGSDDYQAELVGLAQDGGLIIRRNDFDEVLYSSSIFPL